MDDIADEFCVEGVCVEKIDEEGEFKVSVWADFTYIDKRQALRLIKYLQENIDASNKL